MKNKQNADNLVDQVNKSKDNPPIGTTPNPTRGSNVENADKVAAEFKKANHIDDEGHIDVEALRND